MNETKSVVYASGIDAHGNLITEALEVPMISSVQEVERFAGQGSELSRMMAAALDPNPLTWEQRLAKQEREAFEKATKIDVKDYTGWMFWPKQGEDGFFESLDELRAFCANHKMALPAWVWACTSEPFRLSADDILDQALEEHFEGARGEIPATEEKRLQAFLDEWAAAQKIVSWHEDRTRAVMLTVGDP